MTRAGGSLALLGCSAGLFLIVAGPLSGPDAPPGVPGVSPRARTNETHSIVPSSATAIAGAEDPIPADLPPAVAPRGDSPPRTPAPGDDPASEDPQGLYAEDPDWLASALSELTPAQVSRHLSRVLTLLDHADEHVRSSAVLALGELRERPLVLAALAERYGKETDPFVRVEIAEIWTGPLESASSWDRALAFLVRLWELDAGPQGRWTILSTFATLGREFPALAVSRLRALLASGYPQGDPPSWAVRDLVPALENILAHGRPFPADAALGVGR